jgi:glutaredoxin
METVMTLIRWLLGRLILSLEFITRPAPLLREKKEQEKIDFTTSKFSLYQFNACPFCVKVRRHIRKFSLNIELKDAKNNISYKEELIIGGGAHKVPCLRVDHSTKQTKWLYESDEIIAYLKKKFPLS